MHLQTGVYVIMASGSGAEVAVHRVPVWCLRHGDLCLGAGQSRGLPASSSSRPLQPQPRMLLSLATELKQPFAKRMHLCSKGQAHSFSQDFGT